MKRKSKGGYEKKKPHRHGRAPGPSVGWELRHSPYTAEGRIESAYRFAIGARNQTGWRRRVLLGLGLLFPVGLGLVLVIKVILVLIHAMR